MKSQVLYNFIRDAVVRVPEVEAYLSPRTRVFLRLHNVKAKQLTREQMEKLLAKKIAEIEQKYLKIFEESGGQVSQDFWRNYERDLQAAITEPIRGQLEANFLNSNEAAGLLDVANTNSKLDAAITAAILAIVLSISRNTQTTYAELLAGGIFGEELLDRIALRFSSGHAEQIAITELTRAEARFSQVLSDGLNDLGLPSQQRWLTYEDEKVCPICAPADHKLKDEPITTSKGGWNGQTWGQRFPHGSPAHPNCRCQISVEVIEWKP